MPENNAEWAILSVYAPGEPGRPAAVLLLDQGSNILHMRISDTVGGDHPLGELWPLFCEDLRERSAQMGGRETLDWLAEFSSHALRIGDRKARQVADFPAEANALYDRFVLNREPQSVVFDSVSR